VSGLFDGLSEGLELSFAPLALADVPREEHHALGRAQVTTQGCGSSLEPTGLVVDPDSVLELLDFARYERPFDRLEGVVGDVRRQLWADYSLTWTTPQRTRTQREAFTFLTIGGLAV